MPTGFAAADAKSSAAVDRFMGETLLLLPQRSGGEYTQASIPDPDRPPVEFKALLSGATTTQNLKGDRSGYAFNSANVIVRERSISVTRSNWPAGAREHDHVRAVDQPGQPVYRMSAPVDDGMNRVVCQLVLT